ncbi:MAG: ATP--guanido phosphotransferase [bacterium]
MPLQIDTRRCVPWLEDGDKQRDVIISSRIRFARNLVDYPFPNRCDKQRKEEVRRSIETAAESIPGEKTCLHLDKLETVEKNVLFERRLASRELLGSSCAGLIYSEGESPGLMINEEDHLRLQLLGGGNKLEQLFKAASELLRNLEKKLRFSYDEKWGYLTVCPTNIGTGLRASVLLHLPGLVLTKKIGKVLNAISNLGLTVRGFYGEGSSSQGFYFQLSNQVTLGRPAKELCQTLCRVSDQIVDQERRARQNLFAKSGPEIEDRIGRAYGILNYCRRIATAEAMNLISLCRLGVGGEIVASHINYPTLDGLLFLIQPGHLEHSLDEKLAKKDRDYYRSERIKTELSA